MVTGWHRVPRGRYPTLKKGGGVTGAVTQVSARAFGRLCAYEGDEYRLRQIAARHDGKTLKCLVWIK